MTLTILLSDEASRWDTWEPHVAAALAEKGIDAALVRSTQTPESIDYIVYAPTGGLSDFTPFTRTKAVLSLWAGVDSIVTNPTLTQPLTRMVDDGLREGMIEYCVGHTLRYHLGMDTHIHSTGGWNAVSPPLARNRSVGILGFGALGQAVGEALVALNFDTHGWSRNAKRHSTVTTHHGDDGFAAMLGQCEILINLLPDTPATENTLNAAAFARCPAGTSIINAGRGPAINDTDLIAALDAGVLGAATLDVFRVEPLPADHPFWAHPKVTVTPHIAAETRPETASVLIAENIRRAEAGEPLMYLVDRSVGY